MPSFPYLPRISRRVFMLTAPGIFADSALAHGPAPAPRHGGQVRESDGEHWVELVHAAGRITVYVNTQDNRPIPIHQLSGKAILVSANRRLELPLALTEDGALATQLPADLTEPDVVSLVLIVDSRPARVRFSLRRP